VVIAATIRPEAAGDRLGIRHVNEAAFGTSDEADLVDLLRADGFVLFSAVAQVDDQIAGHILFSRMTVETPTGAVPAAALAPLSVMPACQRQGLGSRLIAYGLKRVRDLGERIVIVVGHPAYYPRFGFSSERARPLDHPFPPDVFMALELVPGALDGVHGRVRYPAAFGV